MASLSAIPAGKRYLFVIPADNYRPDFYIQENIIGYTGDRDRDPTVYFLDAPFQGVNKWHFNVEYGRITQCYPDTKNIGRERVCMGGCTEFKFSMACHTSMPAQV